MFLTIAAKLAQARLSRIGKSARCSGLLPRLASSLFPPADWGGLGLRLFPLSGNLLT